MTAPCLHPLREHMMNTIPPSRVNGVTGAGAAAPTNQHRTSALSQALTSADNSQTVLANMTLREKIGQKIMLDFRYWGRDNASGAAQDTVALNANIENILCNYHIGGVILFANNLKNADQIRHLTAQLAAVPQTHGIGLMIATDNEGGNVFRLPRGEYTAFAGNMALGATVRGSQRKRTALPARQDHGAGTAQPGHQRQFCAGGGRQQQSGQPGYQRSRVQRFSSPGRSVGPVTGKRQ